MKFTSGPNRPELFEEHLDLLSLYKSLIGQGSQKVPHIQPPGSCTETQPECHAQLYSALPFLLPTLILTNCFSSGSTDCFHGNSCCGKQNCPIFTLWLAHCGRMWTQAMAWLQSSVKHPGDTLDGKRKPHRRVEHSPLRQLAPARSSSLGPHTHPVDTSLHQ